MTNATAEATMAPIAVSVPTAARLLDATPNMVGFWIRTGKLPAAKIGRNWRIRVDDIDAVLARKPSAHAGDEQ